MTVTMAEVHNRNKPQFIAQLAEFPDSEDFNAHVSARVFSFLAETAGPILEHFHSDLFWDARFLQDQIVKNWDTTQTVTWNWSVNSTGTNMSTMTECQPREYAFKCSLWAEDRSYGTWIMFQMERV